MNTGRLATRFLRRYCTQAKSLTNSEVTKKRNELFSEEKARQIANISRLEKIQVQHIGPPEECTLLMNKGLSTPFNCAMHIQELLVSRSVVALVNGQPWDMHKPLVEDCELQFLHFKDEDPKIPNEALWRTGSYILGYVLENAFKDNFYVELCSFPKPDVRSGSFVYDADLKTQHWQPTPTELNCLSTIGFKLQCEDIKFEPLEVDASVALKIFEDNRFKSAQIPHIAATSTTGNTVTLYRMGTHVDITRGPLIASTNLIYRFSVTAIHDIESPDYGPLKRVQGIIMPKQLPIHYWTYEFLSERAAKLNPAPIPTLKLNQKLAMENGS